MDTKTSRDIKAQKIIFTVLIIGIAISALLGIRDNNIKYETSMKEKCDQLGGEVVQTAVNYSRCFRKGTVINLIDKTP